MLIDLSNYGWEEITGGNISTILNGAYAVEDVDVNERTLPFEGSVWSGTRVNDTIAAVKLSDGRVLVVFSMLSFAGTDCDADHVTRIYLFTP